MHSNAHIWTAVAYYLIAAVLFLTASRLWNAHPVNRALMLGPYLTPGGVRLMLRHWWLVPAFGAFILSCALEHSVDWALHRGLWPALITPSLMANLGIMESLISLATAGACVWLRVRAWLAA